jgi:porin
MEYEIMETLWKRTLSQSSVLWMTLVLLSCLAPATTRGQAVQTTASTSAGPGLTSDIQDPVVELGFIRAKRIQTRTPDYSLFRRSPLTPLHEAADRAEDRIYDATRIRWGSTYNTLLQGLSETLPGEDNFGMATAMSLVGTWDLCNVGQPNQAEVTFGLEGRWDYDTTGPTDLGPNSLGSLGFTANPFAAYTPTFLVRNLFWRQGGRNNGAPYVYRIGRITPDAILATSAHLNGFTTFMPVAGTGPFAMGLPDSGLGFVGGWFINDWSALAGLVSDSNANRQDFGDIDEGDLFVAVELHVKVLPLTEKAGFSKVTFWHNDGTKFGQPINGSTGLEGWGVFIKHEQELSRDGRAVAIARWGKSYRDAALYEDQASGHFVLYDPFRTGKFEKDLFSADLFGMAYSWVQPSAPGSRDESNLEFFYRFPLFPEADATLSYQSIFNPALSPSIDSASVFSFRLRSTF